MLSQHLGKAITEPQRRRWVSLLMDAADEVGLPDDPEFRAAFAGYVEWGTRLALANSQPGAEPPCPAPVPKWGWGVAPPYQGDLTALPDPDPLRPGRATARRPRLVPKTSWNSSRLRTMLARNSGGLCGSMVRNCCSCSVRRLVRQM